MHKQRRDSLKKSLYASVAQIPEAKLTKNRYKLIHWVLKDYYPIVCGSVSPDTLREFLKTVVYLDRNVRWATEKYDKEEKTKLSQQFQVDEGYEAGHEANIKRLNKIV